jgi:D-alanyl-D-alanine carboxypeptidase (penicillin-binding protein 5/6)
MRYSSRLHHFTGRTLRIATFALAILALVSTQPISAQDEPANDIPEAATPNRTAPSPDLLRLSARVPQPDIKARAAILIDAISGQVLYEQNADTPMPMASTTKIMTALLLCEHLPETAIITASAYAAKTPESSLHLKAGEQITAHDLLRAILMRSANDGCVACAEQIAGSEAAFVDLMNQRAVQLGATHTHFANTNGLPNKDHYTSARDLALIAQAALREPRINEVVKTRKCVIQRSIDKQDVHLRNHSHFLGAFPGADGVKTGWTVAAGHCYVGSATWNGWRLISVVLHSPSYVRETADLMKFGFYNYEAHTVARLGDAVGQCTVNGGVKPDVSVSVGQPVQVIAPRGVSPVITHKMVIKNVEAPVKPGQMVGTYQAIVDNQVVCSAPVTAVTGDDLQPPLLAVRNSRSGLPYLLSGFILISGLVSLRYGTKHRRVAAITKGARRRWRRVATSLRGND